MIVISLFYTLSSKYFDGTNKQQVAIQVFFLKILYIKFLWILMKVYKVFKLNDIICLKLQITYFKDVITYVRYKF